MAWQGWAIVGVIAAVIGGIWFGFSHSAWQAVGVFGVSGAAIVGIFFIWAFTEWTNSGSH
jgi:hypothetical protein